jgi:hypothetical protein
MKPFKSNSKPLKPPHSICACENTCALDRPGALTRLSLDPVIAKRGGKARAGMREGRQPAPSWMRFARYFGA